jgi:hypothetical protein
MNDRADDSLVERLEKLWLAWFCIYMATGAFAMMQNRTGFFADALDHVQSIWVKLVFLNIPLQIVLALIANQLNRSHTTGARKTGNAVAVINTVLIVVHIVISIAVRFMP